MARPIKYNKKKLEEGVKAYFDRITYVTTAKDEAGIEILNMDREAVLLERYAVPPSVSGLCLYLGIDRSTWQNYCDKELHPEFQKITQDARARMEAYLEEQLLTREKSLQGVIFNLQNNFGWRQKQEVELGKETRKAAAVESLSIKEKLALIAAEKEVMDGDEEAGSGD